MNAAAPQIWSIFCQVHRPEPLHHSVVGPLGDLCWCDVVLDTDKGIKIQISGADSFKTKGREELWLPVRYLIRGSSPETVGFVGVEAEDLNGPLDAEMMENTAHLQRQQVLLGNRIKQQQKELITKSCHLLNDLFRGKVQSEYKRIVRKEKFLVTEAPAQRDEV